MYLSQYEREVKKMKKLKHINQWILPIGLLFMLAAYSLYASNDYPQGIILDGSLSNTSNLELTGPNYEIKADYGKLEQSNLFHSFSQFNLHAGESAVFSGPETVQNIISRVTGQNVSWIDGTIESSIPNANLYLLNPAGIVFGKNANLDISGSFYVSTADYLKLEDNARFNVHHISENDILTSSAPAAFGFLDSSSASISFLGDASLFDDQDYSKYGIHVPDGNTISLIAEHIDIKGPKKQLTDSDGYPVFKQLIDENGNPVFEIAYDKWGFEIQIPVPELDENNNPIPVWEVIDSPTIQASGGNIYLITAGPETEISINPDDINIESLEGNIQISEYARLSVSAQGAGNIIIKGGQFVLDHSQLLSETLGDINGGKIDIQANDVYLRNDAQISANINGAGKGSDIIIQATNTILAESNNQVINIKAQDYQVDLEFGNCGVINLKAKNLIFKDKSEIYSTLRGKESAIHLEADNILFADESIIISTPEDPGYMGNISIKASETIEFQSSSIIMNSFIWGKTGLQPGKIHLEAGGDIHFSSNAFILLYANGPDGKISISGNNISFVDGSCIETHSRLNEGISEVKLMANESILFEGKEGIHGEQSDSSYIYMRADDQGNLPSLLIDAQKNISFLNGAYIYSSNEGTGKGADIKLTAQERISFASNILNWTVDYNGDNFWGETGIRLETQENLQNEGNAGSAGNVSLDAGNILFTDGAYINASTFGSGMGGTVSLNSKNVLFDGEATWFGDAPSNDIYFWNTRIDITSSGENKNSGNAGTLHMNADNIAFSNGAFINTETLGPGQGGSINLAANNTITFSGEDDDKAASAIHAATKYHEIGAGNAGTVEIHAKHVLFEEGAYINSSSYGAGNGGNVRIEAENISLSSTDSNGKPSNIYSGSESTSLLPGNGGTIYLSANQISLSSQAFLSTASKGNGKAGNIELHAKNIYLDNMASVTSGSESNNYFVVENKEVMDARFIILGDRIFVSETQNMYVFAGKSSGGAIPFVRYYKADTYVDLLHAGFTSEGDMAQVFDDSTGHSADYISVYSPNFVNTLNWHSFDPNIAKTFPDMTEINQNMNKEVLEKNFPEYANAVIKVLDDGNGKEALFVCTIQEMIKYDYDGAPFYRIKPLRIGYFNLEDPAELNTMANQQALQNGDLFHIESNNSEYVFYNEEFIKLNNTHTMKSKDALFDLVQAQTGDLVKTSSDGSHYIFSGKEWIRPGKEDLIVPDLAAMQNLDAESGDIVYVIDTDNNPDNDKTPGNFLFSENQWIPFGKGQGSDISIYANNLIMNNSSISTSTFGHGNAAGISLFVDNIELNSNASIKSESTATKFGGSAGTINIDAKGEVRLLGNSSFSTRTLDASGGKVVINAEKGIYLLNGKITSSVKQGAGEGGDVDIQSKNIVLNHGKITANADEGDGGAIFIVAENFIKSTDSIIEATSERGNDGTVKIEAPDINVTKGLSGLSSKLLDASRWVKTPCAARSEKHSSRFIIKGRDATPTRLDDLWASPLIPFYGNIETSPEVHTLFVEAQKEYEKGNIARAAKSWETITHRVDQDSVEYLTAIDYLVHTLQSLGFQKKALNLCQKTLSFAEKYQKTPQGILFYNILGDLNTASSLLEKSMTYYKIALKNTKKLKQDIFTAAVLNNIANTLIVNNEFETGIQLYDKALLLLEKSDHDFKNSLKAKIHLNLTFILAKAGTYQDVIAAYENTYRHVKLLPDNHEKGLNLIAISKVASQIQNFFPDQNNTFSDNTLNLLLDAERIGEKIMDKKIISMASGFTGQYLETLNQVDDAIQKTRKAIFYADKQNDSEILYVWQWQLGRLFKKCHQIEKAITAFKNSISTLSKIRSELFSGSRMQTNIFETNVKPVYMGLAGLYLDQADHETDPQLKENKIILARNVMESLKNAELQDYFEDECVSKNQKKKPNMLLRTPEGVALLYPIALSDRLTILITLPDAIQRYSVDIQYTHLNKVVKQYRKQVQTRTSNEFLATSRKLYQWIIRPAEKALAESNIHTLLVAPDGVLRLIPFSSLNDGSQFLVEKYAIATIPAINLTDTKKHVQKSKNVLISGLSDAVQDFSALPSVQSELTDIKSIMNAKNMLFNKEYTLSKVTDELQTNDYNIVHFATHGIFGGTGKDSFLLTYESQLDMDNLETIMSLGKYRNHQVDLLTLSACQTALGDERAALGLAGVAVKAGVRSAVATLWYIDDEATSLAVRELYRQLKKENISKAMALQNAQKMLIAQPRYWHPVYWAPFLLIGSWI